MKKFILFLVFSLFISNVNAMTFDVTNNTKINNSAIPDWYTIYESGRGLGFRYDDYQQYSQMSQTGYASYGYLYFCGVNLGRVSTPPSCSTGCITSSLNLVNLGGSCTITASGVNYNGNYYFLFYSVNDWAWDSLHTVPYFSDTITFYPKTSGASIVGFMTNNLTDSDYYIEYASSNRLQELQDITNQRLEDLQSSINNQTTTINNQTNVINDDSLPDTSNFLDDWTDLLLENNTINQILYLPVNLLTNIKSAFNGNCSNLTIPFGLTGGNETLTFNCWNIEDYLGSEITTLITSIIQFYLIYYFALFLWKFYDDFTSMKDTLSIILENPDGPLQKGEIE